MSYLIIFSVLSFITSQLIKVSKRSIEDSFHDNGDNKFLKVLYESQTKKTFDEAKKRLLIIENQIKFKLKEKNEPQNSIEIEENDKCNNKLYLKLNHKYIGGEIFMDLFNAACGHNKIKVTKSNYILGIISLIKKIFFLKKILIKKEYNINLLPYNTSIQKEYIIKIKKDGTTRGQAIKAILDDLQYILHQDYFLVGIPVPFSGTKVSNNVGVGFLEWNHNYTNCIMDKKIKRVKEISIATNFINNRFNFFCPKKAFLIRKKLDIIMTMFYYNGKGESLTDWSIKFIPGKKIIEQMYISACSIKLDNKIKITCCITTRNKEIVNKLLNNKTFFRI